jgi:hypothetical protein
VAKKTAKTVQRSQKGRENQLRRMAENRQVNVSTPASAPIETKTASVATAKTASADPQSMTRVAEYSFIKADLLRVGILAVAIFAIMGALTFIVR